MDANYEFLCSYLAELSMVDYGAMRWLPSQVAASCVLLALFMLGKPAWSPTLRFYTGYVPGDLRDCVQVRAAACLFLPCRRLPPYRRRP